MRGENPCCALWKVPAWRSHRRRMPALRGGNPGAPGLLVRVRLNSKASRRDRAPDHHATPPAAITGRSPSRPFAWWTNDAVPRRRIRNLALFRGGDFAYANAQIRRSGAGADVDVAASAPEEPATTV